VSNGVAAGSLRRKHHSAVAGIFPGLCERFRTGCGAQPGFSVKSAQNPAAAGSDSNLLTDWALLIRQPSVANRPERLA